MRRILVLAAVLAPLTACYAPPYADPYGYAQPYGYGQPDGYQPDGDAGYVYNDGAPYMTYEGAAVPLIFFGGYWGFYDREHRFHRAPESIGRDLNTRHPQGAGVTPFGGRVPPPTYGGGYHPVPAPQYRPNPPPPTYVAPPVHTMPAPAYTPPAPFHPAPAPALTPHPTEHHDHHCPPGQTHC